MALAAMVAAELLPLPSPVLIGCWPALARVAEAVGFDSLSHFSKCYMDAHGVRPSEDRQRHFTTPGDQPGDGLMGDVSKLKQASVRIQSYGPDSAKKQKAKSN